MTTDEQLICGACGQPADSLTDGLCPDCQGEQPPQRQPDAKPDVPAASRVPARAAPKPLPMTNRGIQLTTFEDAYRFAVAIVQSGLAPKSLNTPQKVLLAIQTGMEAGLTPLQSVQSVVPINGMPTWKGDAALALARNSGLMDDWRPPVWTGTPMADDWTCTITSQRKGISTPCTTSFSVADAKRARLWGKAGPWTDYPKRMMYYRPLGYHLRDYYSDALMGLKIAEEVRDYPAAAFNGNGNTPALPSEDPLLDRLIEQRADNTSAPVIDAPQEAAPQDAPVTDGPATDAPGDAMDAQPGGDEPAAQDAQPTDDPGALFDG